MLILSKCILEESAYHEAGHAVIAHAMNLRVNYARVVWDPQSSCWNGSVKATPGLDDSASDSQCSVIAASKARESMAGMLAQAKFMASQRIGTDPLTFNRSTVHFGDLWPLLKEGKRSDESPGMVHLEFQGPDSRIHTLWFQANACLISQEDINNFNYYANGHSGRRPAESPEQLIVETMRLLDDEGRWNAVRTIAVALVNEGQGRYLDEIEVTRLLATSRQLQAG
jgi:hypothetical protein